MKKRVILMAGLLAMALAGSAQAATMFAVQDSGANDKMVVTDAGWIGVNTPAATGPVTPFHVQTAGTTTAAAGFLYQFTNNGSLGPVKAPNFSFMRNNDPAATGTKNVNDATLPRTNDMLGIIQFGTVVSGGRVNMVSISAKAEADSSAAAQPGYLAFSTASSSAALTERMRITGAGNVLISNAFPTLPTGNLTALNVVGLPVFADNTAATTGGGGLAPGALYRTSTGVLMVAF